MFQDCSSPRHTGGNCTGEPSRIGVRSRDHITYSPHLFDSSKVPVGYSVTLCLYADRKRKRPRCALSQVSHCPTLQDTIPRLLGVTTGSASPSVRSPIGASQRGRSSRFFPPGGRALLSARSRKLFRQGSTYLYNCAVTSRRCSWRSRLEQDRPTFATTHAGGAHRSWRCWLRDTSIPRPTPRTLPPFVDVQKTLTSGKPAR